MKYSETLETWIAWKQLEAERKGEKFTKKLLAERSGLTQSYISKITTGTTDLGIKVIEKLCLGLGISLPEFFAGPPGTCEEKAKEIENDEDYRILGDPSELDLKSLIMGDIQYFDKSELTRVAILTHKIKAVIKDVMSKKGA